MSKLVNHYIEKLGWGLVKLNGKKPVGRDWPNRPIVKSGGVSGNIGLNHGFSGTCVLDVDHIAAEYALKLAGVDLTAILDAAPYKIVGNPDNPPKPLFRLPPGIKLTTKQFKWPHPDEDKLIAIFELRGGPGFQDVLPPSIHPDTHEPYAWIDGPPPTPADIPIIPQDLLALWLTWDTQETRLKSACPWVEPADPPPTPTPRAARDNGSYNPDFDVSIVQTEFNRRYTPGNVLEKHGYIPRGKKWLCPNSDSGNPGVMPLGEGDKIMSFHGSDPLGDGRPHDAYDCYVILEHGGDRSRAWHTAKADLDIDVGKRAVSIARANEAERALAGDDDSAPSEADLLPFPAADEGNAQAVLLLHGDKYLFTNELGWLRYNDKCWAAKGAEEKLKLAIVDTLIERRAQAVRADLERIVKATKPSATNVRNCKYMLESILWASIDDFDNDPDRLNCANGVVNLRTGQLTPHEAGQRFTYCIDTPYDPDADDTEWEQWLHSSVTPTGVDDNGQYADLVTWLQMAIGYSLTGHTHEQCLFFLQGPPRAGKGLLLQILNKLLSRPLSSGVIFDTFTAKRGGDNQNFDLAPLKSCRLITASESERTSLLNASLVKSITGNDPIRCAFKHKTSFEYTPQFKIWLSSNFKIKAQADDDALWSRLRIIQFPNSHLGKEDFGLEGRLWKHRAGILKWAIGGAMEWYKRKDQNIGLGRPDIITRAVQDHRGENDTVGQFIEDCCIIGPDKYLVGKQLTAEYRNWCDENGRTPLGGNRLGEALRRRGLEYKQKKVAGVNKKRWVGIGLVV